MPEKETVSDFSQGVPLATIQKLARYWATDYDWRKVEARLTMAAVAREVGVNALVNMSQMTVSQMSLQNTTPSHQQRLHWLSEQALMWSGLPVVTIRPTMFLESFVALAGAAVRDRGRIELPFGRGKTNPVAATDVARMVATILADPGPHVSRIYELTGPRSQDMHAIAREFSEALNRDVTYFDILPPRGLGTGAEEGRVARAPERASADDGRVAPGESV